MKLKTAIKTIGLVGAVVGGVQLYQLSSKLSPPPESTAIAPAPAPAPAPTPAPAPISTAHMEQLPPTGSLILGFSFLIALIWLIQLPKESN